MTLWSGGESLSIDAHLADDLPGWHGREAGAHRWTSGGALLPLSGIVETGAVLSIEIQAAGPYLAEPQGMAIEARRGA